MGLGEKEAEANGLAADFKIANGGAAFTAYRKLQFSDDVKSDTHGQGVASRLRAGHPGHGYHLGVFQQ